MVSRSCESIANVHGMRSLFGARGKGLNRMVMSDRGARAGLSTASRALRPRHATS